MSQVNSETVELTGDQHIHLSLVLRAKVGDKVSIAADGYICSAVVFACSKKSTTLKIVSKAQAKVESNIDTTLYFARQKSEHSEFTVQKAVELGVNKIIPVKTRFVCPQVSKIDRLNKIAFSAAAQSGRGIVPVVEEEIDFDRVIEEVKKYDFCVFPYEKEKRLGLREFLRAKVNKKDMKKIAIFIGSEGGFSDEEVDKAVKADLVPVSLGRRILRAETASLAVLSCLMYEFGELSR